MIIGAHQNGLTSKILGISVDEKAETLKARVADLATRTAETLGKDWSFKAEEVLVNDSYTGEGYAVMGRPEIEAVRLFARHEALLLDPVYTGRAAAGLIDLSRKGFFDAAESVLFWHTGGGPALFASRYQADLI
jgi:1-aminocyclopropane-1-carboxylate deaminase/D-cysteine desulfhydrase-like pyridoxal-dependent ACC family enzyme